MRGIFLTIFLWFWLALTLMAVSVALITWAYQLEGGSMTVAPAQPRRLQPLQLAGALALRDVRGDEAFTAHRHELEESSRIQTYFLDVRGDDIGGEPVPPALRAFAIGFDAAKDVGTRRFDGVEATIWELRDGTGQRIIAIAVPRNLRPTSVAESLEGVERGGPTAWWSFDFLSTPLPVFALRLVTILLVAGIGCYALARSLTAPVRRLQRVVRQFASGDLDTRVDPQLSKRADEIGELSRDVDAMALRVASLLTSQQRLLQDVSHESRSPLARLHVALEIARGSAGVSAEAPLARVGREADRLNELIEQLLTLAKLESAPPVTERSPIEMISFVAEIVGDADFEAAATSRHVRMTRADACSVVGSPSLLRSAIENVVRNALQHSPPNGEVEVSVLRPPDHEPTAATILVRDHGNGVPPDALERIFVPFYRVDDQANAATDRARRRGTGLGLAIADRAVRSHGGTIIAANAESGGLLVRIDLPKG